MELDFLTILKELNKLTLDYLVVGGLAVNFYGVPRMTYDMDIMVLLEPENLSKLVIKLNEWGYRPKISIDPLILTDKAMRESFIQNKGMRALTFYSNAWPISEIDLVFDSPIPYPELKARAVMMEVAGEKVPVVSIHDLIQLKLSAGRKQDLADVEHLKIILERL